SALAGLTGLLAENEALVKAVGLAFAAWGAGQIIGRVIDLVSGMAVSVQTAASKVISSVTSMDGGFRKLAGSAARMAAFPLVIAAAAAAFDGLATSSRRAREAIEKIDASAAGKGLEGLRDAYNETAAKTQDFTNV